MHKCLEQMILCRTESQDPICNFFYFSWFDKIPSEGKKFNFRDNESILILKLFFWTKQGFGWYLQKVENIGGKKLD